MAVGSLLVVAADVMQPPNHKEQLVPMLGKITALPGALGKLTRCWRTEVTPITVTSWRRR